MYTCSMCKANKEGEAAMQNGAGSFCPECKAIIHAKSTEALRARSGARTGHCLWCGQKITPETAQSGKCKENENVCRKCDVRRDWLLRVIRHSDRPARYAARAEERERPIREEREKAIRDAQIPIAAAPVTNVFVPPAQMTLDEARLRRLERMMSQISQALGV